MCSRTCAVVALSCVASFAADDSLTRWKVHDRSRPLPPVITPAAPGKPPSDAIVLFDGKDLSKWRNGKGGPAEWRVRDGFMEVAPGTKDIHTGQAFGSCQLHVEWATPDPPREKDQGRGNSGVYLMNVYELQVLDSYRNQTYADGQAGAVYGQYPPLVNASLPPGQWQSYDVVFHRPHFADDGKVLQPARITVLHNGVLVQDNVSLTGPTWYMARPPYKAHPDKLPILLQDHDQPVRFRNIWIRELAE
jgi:hypothetical protein